MDYPIRKTTPETLAYIAQVNARIREVEERLRVLTAEVHAAVTDPAWSFEAYADLVHALTRQHLLLRQLHSNLARARGQRRLFDGMDGMQDAPSDGD